MLLDLLRQDMHCLAECQAFMQHILGTLPDGLRRWNATGSTLNGTGPRNPGDAAAACPAAARQGPGQGHVGRTAVAGGGAPGRERPMPTSPSISSASGRPRGNPPPSSSCATCSSSRSRSTTPWPSSRWWSNSMLTACNVFARAVAGGRAEARRRQQAAGAAAATAVAGAIAQGTEADRRVCQPQSLGPASTAAWAPDPSEGRSMTTPSMPLLHLVRPEHGAYRQPAGLHRGRGRWRQHQQSALQFDRIPELHAAARQQPSPPPVAPAPKPPSSHG